MTRECSARTAFVRLSIISSSTAAHCKGPRASSSIVVGSMIAVEGVMRTEDELPDGLMEVALLCILSTMYIHESYINDGVADS